MEETANRSARDADEKRYGKYRGIVTNNTDPKKLGRLKLRIPSVLAKAQTGWALPCLPYGGTNQQGMFMVPDIGAHIWVEFEEGDINCPIWVGTFWRQEGDAPEDTASQYPNTRMLQTKSGHILQFDDAEGQEQFRLHHPTNAEMVIDPPGTISLTNAQGATVRLDADSGEILIEDANGNSMLMSSSGTTVEDSSGNKIEMASAGITVKASKIVIQGSQVHLGGEGGEPLIKGQSFLGLFATHIHAASFFGGPTSPPIPQGETSTLSTTVKTI